MSTNEANASLAAILCTLAETQSATPESAINFSMGMNLGDYRSIRDIMIRSGLVKLNGNLLTITDEGIAFAHKIESAIVAV